MDLYRGGKGRDISVYPSDSSRRGRRGYGYSDRDSTYDSYDVDPYYDADLYYDRNYVRDRDYDYSYDRRGRYDDGWEQRDGMYGQYGDRSGRRRNMSDRYGYNYPDDSDRYMSRRSYRDGYMDRDYGGNYRSRNNAWSNLRNVFR